MELGDPVVRPWPWPIAEKHLPPRSQFVNRWVNFTWPGLQASGQSSVNILCSLKKCLGGVYLKNHTSELSKALPCDFWLSQALAFSDPSFLCLQDNQVDTRSDPRLRFPGLCPVIPQASLFAVTGLYQGWPFSVICLFLLPPISTLTYRPLNIKELITYSSATILGNRYLS